MTANPLQSDLLTVSQETLIRFLGKTTHWLTPYELSMRTGVSEGVVMLTIPVLLRAGVVKRRKSIDGFNAGEWEYRRCKSHEAIGERSAQYRITGVEPLGRKLQRFLGAKRAREAEQYR